MSCRIEFKNDTYTIANIFLLEEMVSGEVFEVEGEGGLWMKVDFRCVGLSTGCLKSFKEKTQVYPHKCTMTHRRIYTDAERNS